MSGHNGVGGRHAGPGWLKRLITNTRSLQIGAFEEAQNLGSHLVIGSGDAVFLAESGYDAVAGVPLHRAAGDEVGVDGVHGAIGGGLLGGDDVLDNGVVDFGSLGSANRDALAYQRSHDVGGLRVLSDVGRLIDEGADRASGIRTEFLPGGAQP